MHALHKDGNAPLSPTAVDAANSILSSIGSDLDRKMKGHTSMAVKSHNASTHSLDTAQVSEPAARPGSHRYQCVDPSAPHYVDPRIIQAGLLSYAPAVR